MRGLSLRSKAQSKHHYHIHPARNDDWLAIEKLLSYADRQYLALEWWTLNEWLGSPTFLLIRDSNERVVGIMLAVTGDGPVAWLRAITVASERYLTPLLEASIEAVRTWGGTGLVFLGDEAWILSKLQQSAFHRVNQVVTLRHRGPGPIPHGPPGLQVRPVTADDLDRVLAVDHAAFTDVWWYSREVLRRALSLAFSFEAAYLNDECVGYQLCTLRNGRGHIVRLAVRPRFQRQGIGGRLLNEAIKALDGGRAEVVTVNTQDDNLASLQLYDRFAFDRIGKPWSVWFRSLEQV